VKMAVHWDATGPLGTAGKLLQDTPDLVNVTYKSFRLAAQAVVRADIVADLPSPMLKQAVSFVDGIDPCLDGNNPATWAEAIVGGALKLRLGTVCNTEIQTNTVPKDIAWDAYKRTRDFLVLPKSTGKTHPTWLIDWKAALDAEKEAAADAKEATTKATLETTAKAAAAKETADGATASSDVATLPTAARKDWEVGDKVNVKNKKSGVDGMGVVEDVLTKFCWIKFMDDQGELSGMRKKILKDKLSLIAVIAADTDTDGVKEGDDKRDAADAWQEVSDVFG
jgi:hypothetical protein